MAGTRPTNWAGNITYRARSIERPESLDVLRQLVASSAKVRALGSRHSFNTIADTDGVLVETTGLPEQVEIDSAHRRVSVSGGMTYGALATHLRSHGWALANLASLPHITVAGAVATGTHGSGDGNQSLAAAVAGLDVLGPDGEIRSLRRGDADFAGSVVGLGALGIVTRLELDIEPAYDLWQAVYTGLPWEVLLDSYDQITEDRYSVSVFTLLGDEARVWVKQRGGAPEDNLLGAPRSDGPQHIMLDLDAAAMTDQTGVPGPWDGRLPHFRMEFTPSKGEEIQSEYLVPRGSLREALQRLRRLEPQLRDLLQTVEIRSVAGDDLWLSPAHSADVAGMHFTWLRRPDAVERALHPMEEAFLPLGARPHWGKAFVCDRDQLIRAYPRLADFAELRERVDPDHVFGNAWLDGVLP